MRFQVTYGSNPEQIFFVQAADEEQARRFAKREFDLRFEDRDDEYPEIWTIGKPEQAE